MFDLVTCSFFVVWPYLMEESYPGFIPSCCPRRGAAVSRWILRSPCQRNAPVEWRASKSPQQKEEEESQAGNQGCVDWKCLVYLVCSMTWWDRFEWQRNQWFSVPRSWCVPFLNRKMRNMTKKGPPVPLQKMVRVMALQSFQQRVCSWVRRLASCFWCSYLLSYWPLFCTTMV